MSDTIKGHLSASLTVVIWALTFISTKVLLKDFLPIEILFIRFLIGLLILSAVSRKRIKFNGWHEEKYYIIYNCRPVWCFSLLLFGECRVDFYFGDECRHHWLG